MLIEFLYQLKASLFIVQYQELNQGPTISFSIGLYNKIKTSLSMY